MAIYTQTTNGNFFGGSFTIFGGSATHQDAVNDSNNATYVRRTSTDTPAGIIFQTTTASIPGGEVIRRVRWKVTRTAAISGSDIPYLGVYLYDETAQKRTASTPYTSTVTAVEEIGPWFYTAPDGSAWTTTDLSRLCVGLDDYAGLSATRTQIIKVFVEVETSTAPVVSSVASSPATPIYTTLKPRITWTYTDAEGDPQRGYKVRIFSAAQYGIGGFDPATSPATYEANLAYWYAGGSAYHDVETALTNDTTYRAYVKVWSGTSTFQESAWVYGTFETKTIRPTPPAVTRTQFVDGWIQQYVIDGRLNELTDAQGNFEASGPTNWINSTNASIGARDNTLGAQSGSWNFVFSSLAAGAARIRTNTQVGAAVAGDVRSGAMHMFGYGIAVQARIGIYWYGANTYTWGPYQTTNTSSSYKKYVVDNAVAPASTTGWGLAIEFTATAGSQTVVVDAVAAHVNGPGEWGGTDYSISTQEYKITRSTNGALIRDWSPLTGLQEVTFFDYGAPRGVTSGIVVTTRATHSSGQVVESLPVTSTGSNTLTNNWIFRVNSLYNYVLPVTGSESNVVESKGVFYPLGANRAIVVGGSVYGADGSYTITTTSEAVYDQAMQIANLQEPVLVLDPWGNQKWIRITERSWSESNTQAAPVRVVQFSYVEVTEPES